MLTELRVGVIVSTHGLKGELKVMPTTEAPKRFLELKKLRLRMPEQGFRGRDREEKELTIASVRFQKNMVLLKFEGLDRIEDVEKLRQWSLYIDRANALPLKEGEYYLGDYVNLEVRLEDDSVLGIITDVLETGANLVFSVDGGKKKHLIPDSPNIVLEKHPEEGYIKIHPIEGLLEL